MRDVFISVTELSQYVSRAGDIASGSFGGVSGIEGTRLHRKIFQDLEKQYGSDIDTEYSLSGDFEYVDISLHINGRADVVLNSNTDPQLIEIKSFNSTKDSFDKLVRPEHEAQLMLYAYLYMLKNNLKDVKTTLRYVSITSLLAYENTVVVSFEEAERNFIYHCEEYAEFASKLIRYEVTMLASVKDMKFPYDSIRSGQAEFMKNVLASITSKEALFVEAPTGTGKTISTLYPAIKGLLRNQYNKVFYLTAKTATRGVAVKALNDMRKNGLLLRSILMASKISMCPYHKDCDAKFCKYSKNYYAKLKPALDEILMHDDINPELVTKIALAHEICPHEFSLDTLNYCTVVIGDYNHAFDPRVSLVRCFNEDAINNNALLIDESHNLVDRSREMYSASFNDSLFKDMMTHFKGIDARVEALLAKLSQYFKLADQCLATHQSVFAMTEGIEVKKTLMTENWEGTRAIPKNFYEILWKICRFLSPILENLPEGDLRTVSMKFFFEARFFLTIIEQYYNDSYITDISLENGVITVEAYCLDASDKINQILRDHMPAIFFSATLSPYQYYKNVLLGKDADYCRNLSLPYPFPEENLEIVINSEISTKYKDRPFTSGKIAKIVRDEIVNRTGNYMIFFPSYEYLNSVCDLIQKELDKEADSQRFRILRQFPDMKDKDKTEFLASFDQANEGVLLGAAVLGGHFGEGIDLVGDKLSGVIIIGVGVPKVTPMRQILSNYYSEKIGDGYAFAYRFPGWEKVLQAVGRVIRTIDDTGFALLIDDRLDTPEYLSLIPSHWIL